MLTINNLSKTYPGDIKALSDIKLTIGSGMFGLLGPNGAGKSTLLRTLATLQEADEGELMFHDIDIRTQPTELRRCLGYLPQEFGVYPGVSANRLLDYFARLRGISGRGERSDAVDRVLEVVNLTEARSRAVNTYSGGMKQRFGIAQLLLASPRLVIVDEPTAGLDPAERNRFLDILRAVSQESTVILSTHLVDDVRALCSDMAILHEGRVVTHRSPAGAVRAVEGMIWTIDCPLHLPLPLRPRPISSRYLDHATVRNRVYATECPGPEYRPAQPVLEDIYFLAIND